MKRHTATPTNNQQKCDRCMESFKLEDLNINVEPNTDLCDTCVRSIALK
jgi:hypothetical protein